VRISIPQTRFHLNWRGIIKLMQYRLVKKADISISEIGFGAWGIGGSLPGAVSYGETDDNTSRSAIECAIESGINYFDTANLYGEGRSELLIGDVIRRKDREKIIISTKGGYDTLSRSLQQSIDRLDTGYVDIFFLHDPDPDDPVLDETFKYLHRCKSSGLLRAIGVSVKRPEDIRYFACKFDIDVVQVNFNLLDQRLIQDGHIEHAIKNDVGVIVRTPLAFGFLTGAVHENMSFPKDDHRSRWSLKQRNIWWAGAKKFKMFLDDNDCGCISQAALRFCLAFDGVTSVIPGILTPKEVKENAAASNYPLLPQNILDGLIDIYKGEQFFVERPLKQVMEGK
jgi:aryl-alcohol dehydrogenase-like predicted oxidoreductase